MTIRIGITGGIGSGKTVVSKLLEVMGIPVYISDAEAKRIMETDIDVRKELCALVGKEVYPKGKLNRSLLASYMFGHPEHIEQVNGIVHPKVKDDFRRWVNGFETNRLEENNLRGNGFGQVTLVGMESAILLEAGFRKEVDFLVMVYAPLEVRLERAMRRDKSSRETVMKRIESQMSDDFKREQADFIILNDGKNLLIPQVLELMYLLSENNHYLCSAKK